MEKTSYVAFSRPQKVLVLTATNNRSHILIVSVIITFVSKEWWHWLAVIAAIVVVRVLRK